MQYKYYILFYIYSLSSISFSINKDLYLDNKLSNIIKFFFNSMLLLLFIENNNFLKQSEVINIVSFNVAPYFLYLIYILYCNQYYLYINLF